MQLSNFKNTPIIIYVIPTTTDNFILYEFKKIIELLLAQCQNASIPYFGKCGLPSSGHTPVYLPLEPSQTYYVSKTLKAKAK